MDRQYYIDLANQGLKMPIGADLILREKPDAEEILVDGEMLGNVLKETAIRFNTPIALPHMDLELEKTSMLTVLGVPLKDIPRYHFSEAPTNEMITELKTAATSKQNPQTKANVEAVAYIANKTDLLPVGMSIGPFSLMTKLLSDPITPIFLAGTGVTFEEDEDVNRVERVLDLAITFILQSITNQIKAGAKIVFIAEPAANKVYLSPKQINHGSDIFDRYVIRYNLMIKKLLNDNGVDLFFHCCGDLIDEMVSKFTQLDPAILNLGSSRKLWEDASRVPKTTVLFGNLPTKQFYSDNLITLDDVKKLACEITNNMKQACHPFILGSECDVLCVPGCEKTIKDKVSAFMNICENGCSN
ncbi:MAG: uroporphyrinogen decarboxylase family protein [bacterium]